MNAEYQNVKEQLVRDSELQEAYLRDEILEMKKECEELHKKWLESEEKSGLKKVINALYATNLEDVEEVGRLIDIGRFGNYGDL